MRNAQANTGRPTPAPAALPTQQQWQACIRPLSPSQLYHFQWHLLRLEDGSRWSRFGCPASDAVLSAYGAGIDGSDTVVLGYFADGHMRGAALLCSLPAAFSREAEIAFSVETAWQGKGIGTALMAAVVEAARERGIERLLLTCHVLNRRMQRIAEGAGARIGFESCACFAEIDLAAQPTRLALAS